MKALLIVMMLMASYSTWGYNKVELELENGSVMNITRFDSSGETLIIWLPSEHGFSPQIVPVGMNTALQDIDLWAVNLHESYMVPTSRYSLNEVEIEDLMALIDMAYQEKFKNIILVSSSRGAQLALKTAYLWQQQQRPKVIKGMIFFSPHLFKGGTELGKDADFVEISQHSNLPIYLIQEQYSTKYARTMEIAAALKHGGSPVYIETLSGIRGGFYVRPDEDLTEKDILMREQLPSKFARITDILMKTRQARFNDSGLSIESNTEQRANPGIDSKLETYDGNKTPPSVSFQALDDQAVSLDSYRGQVVLVNFWASWCRPCLEEIPSLSRLQSRLDNYPFRIVAINIGESREIVDEFMQKIEFNFDVLLDSKGEGVREWKVYAYPSNYLLDAEGRIQYAYRGALEWDSQPIVDTILELIDSQ